jgi:RNA polymerase sigma-70 factor, ECF subfamily
LDAPTLILARSGDRAAQAALLNSLADTWFRVCLGLLGDAEASREATQECALRLLRELPRFRGDSSLKTFAVGIALNVAREMLRSNPRLADGARAVERATPAAQGPPALAAQAETHGRVRRLLEDLPPRQREAILLRFFEQLSVEQAAAAMGCATGTLKATVHQALRTLKGRLADHVKPAK